MPGNSGLPRHGRRNQTCCAESETVKHRGETAVATVWRRSYPPAANEHAVSLEQAPRCIHRRKRDSVSAISNYPLKREAKHGNDHRAGREPSESP